VITIHCTLSSRPGLGCRAGETERLSFKADKLVGGSDAVLGIDDTRDYTKKGTHSVGVAAQ